MRKLSKNKKAAVGMLATIVIIISVMFAVVIGALVFFAFGNASQTSQTATDTFTITDNSTTMHVNLTREPETVPAFVIHCYNSTTEVWELQDAANWTQVSGTHMTLDQGGDETDHTQLRIAYNVMGYTTIGSVITYAIIVFGMAAIVPLIIIGGAMLKSLGFFGGGKGV